MRKNMNHISCEAWWDRHSSHSCGAVVGTSVSSPGALSSLRRPRSRTRWRRVLRPNGRDLERNSNSWSWTAAENLKNKALKKGDSKFGKKIRFQVWPIFLVRNFWKQTRPLQRVAHGFVRICGRALSWYSWQKKMLETGEHPAKQSPRPMNFSLNKCQDHKTIIQRLWANGIACTWHIDR